MKTYIHKTEHRLRIRSDFIKSNPKSVSTELLNLKNMNGILAIKHKKHAGSVAITFNKAELKCETLLATLKSNNWAEREDKHSYIESVAIKGSKTFAKGVAGMLISKVIGPSVSRFIFR